MLVMALEADRFVLVLPGPAVHGVHELAGDALAATLLQDAVEPGEEHRRFQLEAHEKADRTVLDAGDEHQDVVATAKTPAKRLEVARRSEDLVVQGADQRQLVWTDQIDNRIRHNSVLLPSPPPTGCGVRRTP